METNELPQNGSKAEHSEYGLHSIESPESAPAGYDYTLSGSEDEEGGIRKQTITARVTRGEWQAALLLAGINGHKAIGPYLRSLLHEDAKRRNIPIEQSQEERQALFLKLLMREG